MASSDLPSSLRIGALPTLHRRDETQSSLSGPAQFPKHLSRAPTPTRSSDGSEKPWRDRKLTYIGQNLILFNVWGTLLSGGAYLEYFYNSSALKTPSLLQLSAIFAVQILAMFVTPLPVCWIYQRGWLRIPVSLSIAVMCGSQLMPLWCKEWWQLLLVKGAARGLSMGCLATLGTISTASHFRNNVSFASMICWSGGMLGAVVYTLVPYLLFRDSRYRTVCYVNFGLSVGTLPLVGLLLRKSTVYSKLEDSDRGTDSKHTTTELQAKRDLKAQRPGRFLLPTGFLLTTTGLFVYPLYLPILLSNSSPGSHTCPTSTTLHLLIAFVLAIPSSIVATSLWWRRCFGVLDWWAATSCLAGACYLVLGWMPWVTVSWVVSVVYGICFGMMLPLVVKVAYTVLLLGQGTGLTHKEKGDAAKVSNFCVGLSLLGTGLIAAASTVITALGVERSSAGFKWPYTAVGATMMLGAFCMIFGRVWTTGWRKGKLMVV